jgi:glycosyltransferase involved in cell wall biosynthesis
MTRVAYVTARYPFGPGEAFLGPETRELARRVDRLTVIPTRPARHIVHEEARSVLPSTVAVGLMSPPIVSALARHSRRSVPLTIARLRASRSLGVLWKNLAVAPKAVWLAGTLDKLEVDHVHVHWGGTSSTMAMLACERTGIPWSLTVHRWDIDEDNLLAEKVASATFVRAISHFGARRLRERVPAARPDVLHMGVDVPTTPACRRSATGRLRLLAVGSLTPQKGHATLLEAMRRTGAGITLDVVGDGPLRTTLAAEAREPRLRGRVRLLGALSHSTLLRRLGAGEWDVLVHPSPSGRGFDEGIPVALMEAMAAGVPVIAFPSGGVPELIAPGAGMLLAGTDAQLLADGILELADDPVRADELGAGGIARIRAEFDATRIADQLAERFCAGTRS